MTGNKIDALKKKYPIILEEVSDIECDDGWASIIEGCIRLVDRHSSLTKKGIKIKQIKEKFGRLRIYSSRNDDYTFGVAEMAEYLSELTCETCGERGELRTNRRWVKTLCDGHYIFEE